MQPSLHYSSAVPFYAHCPLNEMFISSKFYLQVTRVPWNVTDVHSQTSSLVVERVLLHLITSNSSMIRQYFCHTTNSNITMCSLLCLYILKWCPVRCISDASLMHTYRNLMWAIFMCSTATPRVKSKLIMNMAILSIHWIICMLNWKLILLLFNALNRKYVCQI